MRIMGLVRRVSRRIRMPRLRLGLLESEIGDGHRMGRRVGKEEERDAEGGGEAAGDVEVEVEVEVEGGLVGRRYLVRSLHREG